MKSLSKIFGLISLAFSAFLAIFLAGKKNGENKVKNKNNEEILKSIQGKKALDNEIDILSPDDLDKRLSKWASDK